MPSELSTDLSSLCNHCNGRLFSPPKMTSTRLPSSDDVFSRQLRGLGGTCRRPRPRHPPWTLAPLRRISTCWREGGYQCFFLFWLLLLLFRSASWPSHRCSLASLFSLIPSTTYSPESPLQKISWTNTTLVVRTRTQSYGSNRRANEEIWYYTDHSSARKLTFSKPKPSRTRHRLQIP